MADAFGTFASSSSTTDPYAGFGAQWGYYTDVETGFQLLGHRYYDAGTGRFVTRDPIGYDGGINLYGYVGNSPTGWIDPEGLKPKGHHIVPQEIWKNGRASKEAAEVFDSFTTGKLPSNAGHTGFPTPHRLYNEAVKAEWDQFLKLHKITAQTCTKEHARLFATRIASSSNPQISSYLDKLFKSLGKTRSSGGFGTLLTLIFGLDALYQALPSAVGYNHRIKSHLRAIDDDNELSYRFEGTKK